MLKLFSFVVVAITLVFLSSCSSTKVLIEPDYMYKRISNNNLSIQIIDNNPCISYSGNLKPEFGEGNDHDLIMNFFKKQLPLDISANTTFRTVKVQNAVQNIQYLKREVTIRRKSIKETLDVKVPSSGTVYTFDGSTPDFVLIIDNLHIGTEFNTLAPMMGPNGMMTGGGTSKYLNYQSDISIWDNTKKELVCYGHIEKCASNLFPVITIDTWKSVSYQYANAVFRQSPFFKVQESE